MATTEERNKNRTRKTKSNAARNRRQKDHRKRLVALGMDEAVVAAMNPSDVRTMLKHPAKVAKKYGSKES